VTITTEKEWVKQLYKQHGFDIMGVDINEETRAYAEAPWSPLAAFNVCLSFISKYGRQISKANATMSILDMFLDLCDDQLISNKELQALDRRLSEINTSTGSTSTNSDPVSELVPEQTPTHAVCMINDSNTPQFSRPPSNGISIDSNERWHQEQMDNMTESYQRTPPTIRQALSPLVRCDTNTGESMCETCEQSSRIIAHNDQLTEDDYLYDDENHVIGLCDAADVQSEHQQDVVYEEYIDKSAQQYNWFQKNERAIHMSITREEWKLLWYQLHALDTRNGECRNQVFSIQGVMKGLWENEPAIVAINSRITTYVTAANNSILQLRSIQERGYASPLTSPYRTGVPKPQTHPSTNKIRLDITTAIKGLNLAREAKKSIEAMMDAGLDDAISAYEIESIGVTKTGNRLGPFTTPTSDHKEGMHTPPQQDETTSRRRAEAERQIRQIDPSFRSSKELGPVVTKSTPSKPKANPKVDKSPWFGPMRRNNIDINTLQYVAQHVPAMMFLDRHTMTVLRELHQLPGQARTKPEPTHEARIVTDVLAAVINTTREANEAAKAIQRVFSHYTYRKLHILHMNSDNRMTRNTNIDQTQHHSVYMLRYVPNAQPEEDVTSLTISRRATSAPRTRQTTRAKGPGLGVPQIQTPTPSSALAAELGEPARNTARVGVSSTHQSPMAPHTGAAGRWVRIDDQQSSIPSPPRATNDMSQSQSPTSPVTAGTTPATEIATKITFLPNTQLLLSATTSCKQAITNLEKLERNMLKFPGAAIYGTILLYGSSVNQQLDKCTHTIRELEKYLGVMLSTLQRHAAIIKRSYQRYLGRRGYYKKQISPSVASQEDNISRRLTLFEQRNAMAPARVHIPLAMTHKYPKAMTMALARQAEEHEGLEQMSLYEYHEANKPAQPYGEMSKYNAKVQDDKAKLKGFTMVAGWIANTTTSPQPPLPSSTTSRDPSDKQCWNCDHFHPDPRKHNKTSWISCPRQWEPRCLMQHYRYKVIKERKSDQSGMK